jgi:hypothetical protein
LHSLCRACANRGTSDQPRSGCEAVRIEACWGTRCDLLNSSARRVEMLRLPRHRHGVPRILRLNATAEDRPQSSVLMSNKRNRRCRSAAKSGPTIRLPALVRISRRFRSRVTRPRQTAMRACSREAARGVRDEYGEARAGRLLFLEW